MADILTSNRWGKGRARIGESETEIHDQVHAEEASGEKVVNLFSRTGHNSGLDEPQTLGSVELTALRRRVAGIQDCLRAWGFDPSVVLPIEGPITGPFEGRMEHRLDLIEGIYQYLHRWKHPAGRGPEAWFDLPNKLLGRRTPRQVLNSGVDAKIHMLEVFIISRISE